MPTPNENLVRLHQNLSSKWEGFNVPLSQFEQDMQDEAKAKRLHENLTKNWQGFNVPFDQFRTDLGYGVTPSNVQDTTPAPAPTGVAEVSADELRQTPAQQPNPDIKEEEKPLTGFWESAWNSTKQMTAGVLKTIEKAAPYMPNGGMLAAEQAEYNLARIKGLDTSQTMLGRKMADLGQKSADLEATVKPTEGLVATLGGLFPQMVGIVASVAAAPFTAGTSLSAAPAMIGGANLSFLISSSVGSSMSEYEKYMQDKGKQANEAAMWGVGLTAGALEYVTEKIALNRYLPKGTIAKTVAKTFNDAGEGYAAQIFNEFAKQKGVQQLIKRFSYNTIKNALQEGGEELLTEIGNIVTEFVYKDFADAPGLEEIGTRMWKSFEGGALMGGILGPVSSWSKSATARKVREQNGYVTVATDKEGNSFEVLGEDGNGNSVVIAPNGEEKIIKNDDLENISRFGLKDFEKFVNIARSGKEISRQQAAESELTQEYQRINQTVQGLLYRGEETFPSVVEGQQNDDPDVVITAMTTDGETYQVIGGSVNRADAANPMIAVNTKTGEKRMLSNTDISRVDIVTASQMEAELKIEANGRIKQKYAIEQVAEQVKEQFQPGDIVQFNGMDAEIVDVTDPSRGITIKVTDAKGNEQAFMLTPEEYSKIQSPQTAQPEQGAQAATAKRKMVIGKKEFTYEEKPDNTYFVPFQDGKDETKVIAAEVDDTQFDVVPVTEEVPVENAAPFAKARTKTVVRGVNIVPKQKPSANAAAELQPATSEGNNSAQSVEENKQPEEAQGVAEPVRPGVTGVEPGVAEGAVAVLEANPQPEAANPPANEANPPANEANPSAEAVNPQPEQAQQPVNEQQEESEGLSEEVNPQESEQAETPAITNTPASPTPASPVVNEQVAGVNGVQYQPLKMRGKEWNFTGNVNDKNGDLEFADPDGNTMWVAKGVAKEITPELQPKQEPKTADGNDNDINEAINELIQAHLEETGEDIRLRLQEELKNAFNDFYNAKSNKEKKQAIERVAKVFSDNGFLTPISVHEDADSVIETYLSLPTTTPRNAARVKDGFKNAGANAFYDQASKTIFICASNTRTMRDAIGTIVHELSHNGTSKISINSLIDIFNAIGAEGISKFVPRWYIDTYISQPSGKNILADELISHIIEKLSSDTNFLTAFITGEDITPFVLGFLNKAGNLDKSSASLIAGIANESTKNIDKNEQQQNNSSELPLFRSANESGGNTRGSGIDGNSSASAAPINGTGKGGSEGTSRANEGNTPGNNVRFSVNQSNSLDAAIKLISAFANSKIYKFSDIIANISKRGVKVTESLLSTLKKAYISVSSKSENPSIFDNPAVVSNYTVSSTPTTAGEKMKQILEKSDAELKEYAEAKLAEAEARRKKDLAKQRREDIAKRTELRKNLNLLSGETSTEAAQKALDAGDITLQDLEQMPTSEFIARFSTQPLELLTQLGQTSRYMPEDMLDPKEAAIADNIGKVKPESVYSNGDRNKVSQSMAKAYFARKDEAGESLDDIALQASGVFRDETSVTPQDVWEFMEKFPNGAQSFYKQKNPDYYTLEDKFENITGVKPTEILYERARTLIAEQKARAEEAARYIPTNEELFGLSAEELAEIEDYVNNLTASELDNEAENNVPLQNEEDQDQSAETGTLRQDGEDGKPDDNGRVPETLREPAEESVPEGEPEVTQPTLFDQPQPTTAGDKLKQMLDKESDGIKTAAAKYGWTTNDNNGKTELINRKGNVAAIATVKGGKYIISDISGNKLLSGNNGLANGVEKVIRDYFFGKDSDVRFRVSESTTESLSNISEKNNVALHNLSGSSILKIDELGGMVMPSIAITRKDIPFNDFGDITLIATSELIDPRNGANVYTRDSWTPTVPAPEYKVTNKLWDFVKQVDPYFIKFNEYFSDVDYKAKRGKESFMSDMAGSTAMMDMFLETKGKGVEPIYSKKKVRNSGVDNPELIKFVLDNKQELQQSRPGDPIYKQFSDLYKKAYVESLGGLNKEDYEYLEKLLLKRTLSEDGNLYFSTADSIINEILDREKSLDQLEKYDTNKAAKKAIEDGGYEDEFIEWLDEKITPVFSDPFIVVRGKKVPYTVDNIYDYMSSQKEKAGQKTMTFGLAKAVSAASRKLNSVDEIREFTKGLVSKEEESEFFDKEVSELSDKYRSEITRYYRYNDTWDALNDAHKAIYDYLKGGISKRSYQRMKSSLGKNGFKDLDYDIIELALDLAHNAANAPTDYIEAKIPDIVSLKSFKYAVIPSDTKQKVRDVLTKNGIAIVEYDDTNRQNRIDAVKKTVESDSDVRFRSQSFYSPTERALQQIKQERGSVAQFKAMLLKNGAKQAEMDWMGWDERFPDAGKMISKADIQQWIDSNKIEVKEVVKGRYSNRDLDVIKVEPFVFNVVDTKTNEVLLSNVSQDRAWTFVENAHNGTNTKYSEYQTPGGENYKEVLLTLPFGKDGWEEYKNHASGKTFRSSHFDEPNILAHVRFNERTDADGNKVLFVEEVQSDWAQKGKKEGFKNGESRYEIREVGDRFMIWNKETESFERSGLDVEMKFPERIFAEQQLRTLSKNNEGVPSMPFRKTDQWVKLALRRVMQYAAENGFDRVAWTSGEIQAERYDLSKQVDRVEYTPKPKIFSEAEQTYVLDVYDKNNTPVVRENDVTLGQIENILGKEIAKKIQNGEGNAPLPGKNLPTYLTGLDLQVGGEGMKAFYDLIIPSAVADISKKFGGKVESVEIPFRQELDYENPQEDLDDIMQVKSIALTPQMKEAFAQPQPLFRKQDPDYETEILREFTQRADRTQQFASRARELGKTFGVPIRIITNRNQLPPRISARMAAGRIYSGVYDMRTGQIYVLVNEMQDIADVEKTIAHEIVAHKGLRNMLGAEKFDRVLGMVYANMNSADIILIKQVYGSQNYTPDNNEVADEYMASLAETGNFPSWFGRVISRVRNLLRKAGFNVQFTDADIMYLLWQSRRRLMKQAGLASYVDYVAKEQDIMENVRFSIIGEQGAANLDRAEEATTRMDNLAVAREMEAANKDAEIIRLATGWERGADGKWRYETNDGQVNTESLKELERNNALANQDVTFDLVTYRKNSNGTYTIFMRKKGAKSTKDFADYRDLSESELRSIIEDDAVVSRILNGEGAESIIGENLDDAKEIQAEFTTFITGAVPITDVVLDTELFKAYPQLKDVVVRINKSLGVDASFSTMSDGMKVISIGMVWNGTKSSISHEIQHAIQDIEGFAKGGNPSQFEIDNVTKIAIDVFEQEGSKQKAKDRIERLMKANNSEYMDRILFVLDSVSEAQLNQIIKDSKLSKEERYRRLSGEVEARNVQTRLNYTPQQRRETLLAETEDVAREDQIFLQQSLGISLSLSEKSGMELPLTLTINGTPRPTTNSKGQFIAQTEEGIRNFYKWFGDSKVVDEQGRPLVVYHGTNSNFNEFKPGKYDAIWAADATWYANQYATTGLEGSVLPIYLKIENPATQEMYDLYPPSELKRKGFDGVILPDATYKLFIAYSPTQIKSATGNNGEFDGNNPDIRFRIAPTSTPTPAGLDPRMVTSKAEQLRELVQDKMLSVKNVQETTLSRGGIVPPAADIYNAENRSQSRSMAMIDNFNASELDDLNTSIAGIVDNHSSSVKEVSQYLKAKSSLQRNDTEGISALSEDAADYWNRARVEQIIADFEAKVPAATVSDLWDKVKAVTDFTIKKLYLGNVISKQAYDGMKARQYYVPLKSWQFDGDNPLDFYDYVDGDRTAYQGLKKADGRKSEADDPLAYMQAAAHSAVVQANKNMVKHKALMLARMNPDFTDLYTIKKVYLMEKGTDPQGNPVVLNVIKDGDDAFSINGYDAAGNPILINEGNFQDLLDAGTITTKHSKTHTQRRPSYVAKQHEVVAYENGQMYIVAFGDPAVALAINNENTYSPPFTRGFQNFILGGRLTRWVSANFTAKNPAFIPINWIRDFGYATTSHAIRKDGNLALFMKNYRPAVAAIDRYLRGKAKPGTNAMDELYEKFREYGGETGFVHLREIESLKKDIEREINRKRGIRKGWDKISQNVVYRVLGKSLDYMALMSENTARFATFAASVEAGKTFEQAATDAKNISVNFNRKGRISGLAGSVYAFFNASIQGGHNLASMAKNNKKRFSVAATGFFVAGIMLSEMLRAFGPEDEEGENEYDKLPDWVRKSCLVLPSFGDGFITIPLPHGFRSIYGAGVALSDAIAGRTEAGAAIFDTVEDLWSAFSPIGIKAGELEKGRAPLRNIIPTAVVPIYDIIVNEDFTGREVYRTPFTKEGERYTPNSEQGSYNVNSVMQQLARAVNRLGGGDENTPAGFKIGEDGKIDYSGTKNFVFDWNPSKAEHMLEYYLGGRGRFFNDIYKTVQAAVSEEKDVQSYNIPVLKRLYMKPYEGNVWSDYYEIKQTIRDYDHFLKQSENGMDIATMKKLYGNVDMPALKAMFDVYDEVIQMHTDAGQVIQDPAKRKEVYDKRKEIMKQFVSQVRKMTKEE